MLELLAVVYVVGIVGAGGTILALECLDDLLGWIERRKRAR
jgi:hypothetical protein